MDYYSCTFRRDNIVKVLVLTKEDTARTTKKRKEMNKETFL